MISKYYPHAFTSLAIAAAVSFSGAAAADPTSAGTAYFGGQYAMVTYDEDNLPEAEPSVIVGRAGLFITDNVSVEGRFGFGLEDDTISALGVDVDAEIDNFFGGYVNGHLPLADQASLYGVIGFTRAKGTASTADISLSDTDSGISWGAGFNFYATEQLGLNLEYMQYLDESGYDVSAIAFGAIYNF